MKRFLICEESSRTLVNEYEIVSLAAPGNCLVLRGFQCPRAKLWAMSDFREVLFMEEGAVFLIAWNNAEIARISYQHYMCGEGSDFDGFFILENQFLVQIGECCVRRYEIPIDEWLSIFDGVILGNVDWDELISKILGGNYVSNEEELHFSPMQLLD